MATFFMETFFLFMAGINVNEWHIASNVLVSPWHGGCFLDGLCHQLSRLHIMPTIGKMHISNPVLVHPKVNRAGNWIFHQSMLWSLILTLMMVLYIHGSIKWPLQQPVCTLLLVYSFTSSKASPSMEASCFLFQLNGASCSCTTTVTLTYY